jgi:hypothetical protein
MGFRTTFAFKFRNALIHSGNLGMGFGGMNASVLSGSVMGSPSKMSTRNFVSNQQQNHLQVINEYGSVAGNNLA